MGKSSKDKRDAYYRLAKEQGWRARSAFKLLQLDEEFNLFENVHRVVDLCAAPGSWSQVLSRVLIRGERLGRATWEDKRYTCSSHDYGSQEQVRATQRESTLESPRNDVKIVAIDLQPMSPLDGITCLKADITHPSTIPLLLEALDSGEDSSSTAGDASRPVDLVLSDGAPDVTGLHDLDIYVQSQLLWAALNLALRVLRPGGKFVAKIFRGKDVDLLYAQLKVVFQTVTVAKPRSSRASSVEAFIVCVNFQPPPNFTGTLGCMLPVEQQPSSHECSSGTDIADGNSIDEKGIITVELQSTTLQSRNTGRDGWIAPFIACGDLSAYDSDASHRLPEGHVSLDPVQPPTAPPYRRALEERRKMGGAYGKTKLDVIKWR